MIKSYHALGFKWHVVSGLVDNGEILFVVKRWRKHKQAWHYEVINELTLNYFAKNTTNHKRV